MTRNACTDHPELEQYVDQLHKNHIEAAPQHGLANICGLDSLVEKARRLFIDPHQTDDTAAAAKSALIQTTPNRGTTRLPTAIAGELCEAGFQFAQIDLDSTEDARKYRNHDELARLLTAVSKAQPLVLLIERIQAIRTGQPGPVQQRLQALSWNEDAVVIIGVDDSSKRRYHQHGVLDQAFDVTFTVPEPSTERRASLLEETIETVATNSGLSMADSLSFHSYADRLDGFDPGWVRNVANRAVTLAATAGEARVTDEHVTNAIGQVEDERPTDQDNSFGRRQQDTGEQFSVETPDVSFDDVGGLDETIERIRTIVEIQGSYADVYDEAGFATSHGMLLAGPPGTGKTLLAKAVANELDRTFLSVKGPEIKHPLYGMTERTIRKLFETADENAPSVLFFDEIDAIAGDRNTQSHGATQSAVTTLLTELDGIEEREDLLVLGATNRRDAIDDALLRPGRFDEVVTVLAPDDTGQKEIFAIHTEGLPLADDVTPTWFADVAPAGLTGADISGICEDAFHRAVTGSDQDDAVLVTRTDVTAALQKVTDDESTPSTPSFQ